MVNTRNNQPGLAKFTKTIPNNTDEGYTYITVLPYSGKVAPYIEEIKRLTRTLRTVFGDALECETASFQTYAEAKAAASGACFLGGDNFAGYSSIMHEVTAESLQNAVNVLEKYLNELNDHYQDYEGWDTEYVAGTLDTIAAETRLWCLR